LTGNKNFSETSVGRYSLALYELSDETKVISEIEKQVISLVNLINNSKDLDFFIKNPTIKKEDQEKIIQQISEKFNLNKLLTKFLCYLISKRRFFYVEKILLDFIEICSKKRGEIKAELLAANDLNKEEIIKIENDLSSSFDSKIKLNFKKDPSLIGGLIVQVSSTMIDTSIKNKIQGKDEKTKLKICKLEEWFGSYGGFTYRTEELFPCRWSYYFSKF